MTVMDLVNSLELEVLSMPCGDKKIEGAYAGDLLSWVMSRAEENNVWATIMTNINVVAVASLVGISATVICENCDIADEVINTAKEKSVNLLRTKLPVYEFCLRLSKLI